MPASVGIWLEVAHHASFRIGGWAFLRLNAGEVRGTAGGARRVDSEQAVLMAIAAALRRVRLVTRRTEPTPGGPAAFAAAWAEFARDRAKDRGDFAPVIPKANLAKAGV